MTLAPVLAAPLAVQLHLATVLPAFALGSWLIFASRKGSQGHRAAGAVYLLLMAVTAVTSLFIQEVNPGGFSPIHLFVPVTLISTIVALRAARRHDIRTHQRAMLGLYLGGLVIAGALTFLPGRLMHTLFLG